MKNLLYKPVWMMISAAEYLKSSNIKNIVKETRK